MKALDQRFSESHCTLLFTGTVGDRIGFKVPSGHQGIRLGREGGREGGSKVVKFPEKLI